MNDRARELFDLAVATKLGSIRPTMALFDCRMIGLYPTTSQPLRGCGEAMSEAERRKGMLSISFGHGFQFADVQHVGAKMLVVTDDDQGLAERVAREFGLRVHALRGQIGFDSLALPMEEALSKALASKKTPVVVADQSDNAGGGAPGDATFALRWLLDHQAEDVAMAIFYDPEVVRIARKAGKGATLAVRLGGKMGAFSGAPVDMKVTILSMLDDYMHALPQRSGEPYLYPAGHVVALRRGSIDIVVGSERCQCFSPSIFSDLEPTVSVTRDTVYPIASTTKAINATMRGRLVDEGLLAWDAPVQQYLPTFRIGDSFMSSQITVRDLLLMRTGLPRHDWLWIENPISRAELVERLRYLDLTAGLREHCRYNNLTHTAAGHIAEIVSAKNWNDLVQQKILTPLGMSNTGFTLPKTDNVSLSYHENSRRELILTKRLSGEVTAPSGGSIHSTVMDMARWVSFNLRVGEATEGHLIAPQTLATIQSPQMF